MTPTFTLHHGDALAVLRDLPSGSVDALITDPPYSSGGMVRGDRVQTAGDKYVGFTTADGQPNGGVYDDFTGDNRDQRGYGYWTALWLGEALRVTRTGGFVLMFTDWRQLPTTTDAMQAGGWVWRGLIPWVKPFARPMRGRFKAQAEFVVWGSHGPIPAVGDCLPGWFEAAPPKDREHMTQKPLDVMRQLVRIVPKDATILDPFMGSGTTGVAALIEGRNFIGVELTDHYHAVAAERLASAARGYRDDGAQLALIEDGGAA